MSPPTDRKYELSKVMAERICDKYGIKTRRVQTKSDLFASNITGAFKPRQEQIVIK